MAVKENVQISSKGIRNSLKKYNSYRAIAEYVWNGFDANASRIIIEVETNEFGKVSKIQVSDNGNGINRNLLDAKFKPFFQSEKIYDPDSKHSNVHGKNGVGRLTFFTFATSAEWTTVYCEDGSNKEYTISVSADSLDHYNADAEILSQKDSGTKVSFFNIIDTELCIDDIESYLVKEFCWYLELNKSRGYAIVINGKELDYSELIIDNESKHFVLNDVNLEFDINFICWNIKLSEYSKYYYINSKGKEIEKENTTYNNKGDSFYHSVFITCSLFDSFDFDSDSEYEQLNLDKQMVKTKKSDEYKLMMQTVNRFLFDKRRPFLKKHVSKVIDAIDIDSAFPNHNENDILYDYRKTQIEDIVSCIYIAQPKIFSNNLNKEQRKTFIRFLDLIMESGEVNSLFAILDEILDMDSDDRNELAEILNYASLSNITKTIKLIKDRLQAVEDLKQLVFNKDLGANEVNHLQKMIESHYWLFGEKFNLVTAAEPNFEEALRRFQKHLHKEYEDVKIDHPDKLKQMDIFAVRQNVESASISNIVVELKHPNISLGETQLSQVKKYMSVIMEQDEFNASNMNWEFYLVGNKFNSNGYIEGELENSKTHGEKSLVYSNKNYKIYVKTWSEIFADFKIKHEYLLERLNVQREKLQKEYSCAQEVIDSQKGNTAIMPEELK